MTAKQVANFLALDVKTVRKYYRELGGIRLGRHYRFFEMEVVNALQNWNEVESPSAEKWEEIGKNIQHEKGGAYLGSRNPEKTSERLGGEDRHSLLD